MLKLTYEQFHEDLSALAKTIPVGIYENIYPIPRGGLIVGAFLSEKLGIPLVTRDKIGSLTLTVDDLIDSGGTIRKLNTPYSPVAVVYRKPHSPKVHFVGREIENVWIEFPYEETRRDAEDNITRILELIGEDPTREGLKDTPARVVKMYDEIFGGYKQDAEKLFQAVFSSDIDEMVVIKDIPFFSHCEHHLVPFFGKVHIAYIPNGKVLGLSKFARLVEIYARRLQIQEKMTQQIADAIDQHLKPLGVAVIVEARHLCMEMRGVKKPYATTKTSVTRGAFREKENTRNEFLELIK